MLIFKWFTVINTKGLPNSADGWSGYFPKSWWGKREGWSRDGGVEGAPVQILETQRGSPSLHCLWLGWVDFLAFSFCFLSLQCRSILFRQASVLNTVTLERVILRLQRPRDSFIDKTIWNRSCLFPSPSSTVLWSSEFLPKVHNSHLEIHTYYHFFAVIPFEISNFTQRFQATTIIYIIK